MEKWWLGLRRMHSFISDNGAKGVFGNFSIIEAKLANDSTFEYN